MGGLFSSNKTIPDERKIKLSFGPELFTGGKYFELSFEDKEIALNWGCYMLDLLLVVVKNNSELCLCKDFNILLQNNVVIIHCSNLQQICDIHKENNCNCEEYQDCVCKLGKEPNCLYNKCKKVFDKLIKYNTTFKTYYIDESVYKKMFEGQVRTDGQRSVRNIRDFSVRRNNLFKSRQYEMSDDDFVVIGGYGQNKLNYLKLKNSRF